MADDAVDRSTRSHAFLHALNGHLAEAFPDRAATIIHDIEATARPIRETNQARIVDEPSKHHLELTSLILASYRVLVPIMPDHEAVLTILRTMLAEPLQRRMQAYLTHRFGIDASAPAHAFDAAAANFAQRGEQLFGEAFTYEQEVQTPQASFVNIRRGFFNDFFTADGAPN